jgi:hypothetical protein
VPREASLREGPSLRSIEQLVDLSDNDIPAAVVCARCGSADCVGCFEEDGRSGIVAIVAWERRDGSVLRRLWQTARQTTRDPEGFFEALPDGPLAPALRFALVSELIATSAMLLAFVPLAVVVAPVWVKELALDPTARSAAFRALVVGVPALATMLVMAHAAHGLALDVGARRSGARPARSRALRFGLYATGWDLVLGPIGAIVVALKEGLSGIAGLARMAANLPSKSARAFLRGAYGLYGARADRAVRVSYLAAIAATLIAAFAILATIVVMLLS